jgi:hypothetical protein
MIFSADGRDHSYSNMLDQRNHWVKFSAEGRDHSYSKMLDQRNQWVDILSRWERPFLLQYARPEKPLDGYSQQMGETILTPIC